MFAWYIEQKSQTKRLSFECCEQSKTHYSANMARIVLVGFHHPGIPYPIAQTALKPKMGVGYDAKQDRRPETEYYTQSSSPDSYNIPWPSSSC